MPIDISVSKTGLYLTPNFALNHKHASHTGIVAINPAMHNLRSDFVSDTLFKNQKMNSDSETDQRW